ncbi:putative ATPase/DNA-binding SARP family transcriptional activator [Streptacidiphilus sp. MAP12-20]|uniref:AfsR/SARP family transcriptional regulator n=1 Tax=Streptacidiphilus sp. MAP12-20 TaxID=3156299 RepID=UPI003519D605
MRFGILGSTLLTGDDGEPVALPGTRLRALVAALALREGRAVPAWALIEEIWAESSPADPQDALQTLVARLRRQIGAEHVGSGPEGYRLLGGDTDVTAFRALVADASGADPASAAPTLRSALALWRGPALADLPTRDDAARRLDAERTAAHRALLGAELALGRAAMILPELAELVAGEPLDESLQALYLRALAAAGRSPEALLAYDTFRRHLADSLGTDPGPALRALHAELLAPGETPDEASASAGAAQPGAGPAMRQGSTLAVGDRSLTEPSGRAGRPGAAATEAGVDRRGGLTPSDFAHGSHAPRPAGNLRARLTSFVGREEELGALRRALPGARLLTLTGPGGTGKTRLAQQAAESVAGAYPDGVWMVELAPLDDPRAVVDAAVGALGLRATQLLLGRAEALGAAAASTEPETPLHRLLEHCAHRTLLLVLDNCEHLVQAAAEFAAQLVAACPGVTVLATSREPLGVAGEQVRPVEPLPDPTALRLLAERGAAARPGFDPGDPAQDPAACAEICRRLDGLPLAIELAAARLRGLTPRQLADRLDRRFALLTSGNRTDLPRQQTLRAVVDWSWELLEPEERTLLARLSVFAGGWTLDAAEPICADGKEISPDDVARHLLSLVDKSLVQVDLSGPEPRYRMLETIHEYAAERLRESGEREALATAHLRWFRELARTTDPLLRSAAQLDALVVLDSEHDNLRAALRRAIDAGEEQEALSLLLGLGWYWMLRNQREEANVWCRAVVALIPCDPFAVPSVPVREGPTDLPPPWSQPVLEEARRAAAVTSFLTADGDFGRDPDPALRRLGEQIVDAYPDDLPQSARLPAIQRVYVLMFAGLLVRLRPTVDSLVEGCRRFGRDWELACVLQARSKLLNDAPGNRPQAVEDAAESLALFTRFGDRWGCVEALAGQAEIANFSGDFAEAVRCAREAIVLAQEIGADQAQPVLRVRLGDALLGLGRLEEGEAELLGGIGDAAAHGAAGQGAGLFGTVLLAGLRMRQQRLPEARELLEGLLPDHDGKGFGTMLNGLVAGMLGAVDGMEGRPEEGLLRIRGGLAEMQSHPLMPYVADQLPLVLIPALSATLLRCHRAGVASGAAERGTAVQTAATLIGAFDRLQTRSAAHHLDRVALDETIQGLRELLGDAGFEAAYAAGTALDAAGAVRLMLG